MTVSNISALFQVNARLSNASPVQGGIDTLITQTVRGSALNSFYSQVISGEALTSDDQIFNGFPTVELNTQPVYGQDGTQLTLNSINGLVVQVIETPGLTSAGFAYITLTNIGTDGTIGSIHMEAGDSFVLLSERGFPGDVGAAFTVGATGLTNCNVVISMLGKTSTLGTGYIPD